MVSKKAPSKKTTNETTSKQASKAPRTFLFVGQSSNNGLTFSGGADWTCYDSNMSTASASNYSNLGNTEDVTTPLLCVVNSWATAIPTGHPLANISIVLNKVSDLDGSKEYVVDNSFQLTTDGGTTTSDNYADTRDAWPKGGGTFGYSIPNPKCGGVPITTDDCLSGNFGFVLTAIVEGTNPTKADSISVQSAVIGVSW